MDRSPAKLRKSGVGHAETKAAVERIAQMRRNEEKEFQKQRQGLTSGLTVSDAAEPAFDAEALIRDLNLDEPAYRKPRPKLRVDITTNHSAMQELFGDDGSLAKDMHNEVTIPLELFEAVQRRQVYYRDEVVRLTKLLEQTHTDLKETSTKLSHLKDRYAALQKNNEQLQSRIEEMTEFNRELALKRDAAERRTERVMEDLQAQQEQMRKKDVEMLALFRKLDETQKQLESEKHMVVELKNVRIANEEKIKQFELRGSVSMRLGRSGRGASRRVSRNPSRSGSPAGGISLAVPGFDEVADVMSDGASDDWQRMTEMVLQKECCIKSLQERIEVMENDMMGMHDSCIGDADESLARLSRSDVLMVASVRQELDKVGSKEYEFKGMNPIPEDSIFHSVWDDVSNASMTAMRGLQQTVRTFERFESTLTDSLSIKELAERWQKFSPKWRANCNTFLMSSFKTLEQTLREMGENEAKARQKVLSDAMNSIDSREMELTRQRALSLHKSCMTEAVPTNSIANNTDTWTVMANVKKKEVAEMSTGEDGGVATGTHTVVESVDIAGIIDGLNLPEPPAMLNAGVQVTILDSRPVSRMQEYVARQSSTPNTPIQGVPSRPSLRPGRASFDAVGVVGSKPSADPSHRKSTGSVPTTHSKPPRPVKQITKTDIHDMSHRRETKRNPISKSRFATDDSVLQPGARPESRQSARTQSPQLVLRERRKSRMKPSLKAAGAAAMVAAGGSKTRRRQTVADRASSTKAVDQKRSKSLPQVKQITRATRAAAGQDGADPKKQPDATRRRKSKPCDAAEGSGNGGGHSEDESDEEGAEFEEEEPESASDSEVSDVSDVSDVDLSSDGSDSLVPKEPRAVEKAEGEMPVADQVPPPNRRGTDAFQRNVNPEALAEAKQARLEEKEKHREQRRVEKKAEKKAAKKAERQEQKKVEKARREEARRQAALARHIEEEEEEFEEDEEEWEHVDPDAVDQNEYDDETGFADDEESSDYDSEETSADEEGEEAEGIMQQHAPRTHDRREKGHAASSVAHRHENQRAEARPPRAKVQHTAEQPLPDGDADEQQQPRRARGLRSHSNTVAPPAGSALRENSERSQPDPSRDRSEHSFGSLYSEEGAAIESFVDGSSVEGAPVGGLLTRKGVQVLRGRVKDTYSSDGSFDESELEDTDLMGFGLEKLKAMQPGQRALERAKARARRHEAFERKLQDKLGRERTPIKAKRRRRAKKQYLESTELRGAVPDAEAIRKHDEIRSHSMARKQQRGAVPLSNEASFNAAPEPQIVEKTVHVPVLPSWVQYLGTPPADLSTEDAVLFRKLPGKVFELHEMLIDFIGEVRKRLKITFPISDPAPFINASLMDKPPQKGIAEAHVMLKFDFDALDAMLTLLRAGNKQVADAHRKMIAYRDNVEHLRMIRLDAETTRDSIKELPMVEREALTKFRSAQSKTQREAAATGEYIFMNRIRDLVSLGGSTSEVRRMSAQWEPIFNALQGANDPLASSFSQLQSSRVGVQRTNSMIGRPANLNPVAIGEEYQQQHPLIRTASLSAQPGWTPSSAMHSNAGSPRPPTIHQHQASTAPRQAGVGASLGASINSGALPSVNGPSLVAPSQRSPYAGMTPADMSISSLQAVAIPGQNGPPPSIPPINKFRSARQQHPPARASFDNISGVFEAQPNPQPATVSGHAMLQQQQQQQQERQSRQQAGRSLNSSRSGAAAILPLIDTSAVVTEEPIWASSSRTIGTLRGSPIGIAQMQPRPPSEKRRVPETARVMAASFKVRDASPVTLPPVASASPRQQGSPRSPVASALNITGFSRK